MGGGSFVNPLTGEVVPHGRPLVPAMSLGEMAESFVKQKDQPYGAAHRERESIENARRIVVKIGTACVTRTRDQRLALGRLGALVEQLEAMVRSGRQMVLVTSGAVSVGRQKLRQQQVLTSSPLEMQIQGPATVCSRAAAAAGQSGLMALYDSLFGMMDIQAAQVLVSSNDFTDAAFRENLHSTVEDLLSMNVVPVFNENDAISSRPQTTDPAAERNSPFRDNDGLASLLAVELKADLLILLTDVDGLFTGPPALPTSKIIHTYAPELHDKILLFGANSTGGRGGMAAKVTAAWMAAQNGCPTLILNGKKPDILLQAASGQLEGTLFEVGAAAALVEAQKPGGLLKLGSGNGLELRAMALAARQASRVLQSLPTQVRVNLLQRIADALESNQERIMEANAADVEAARGHIEDALMQRLALKPSKVAQLAAGIRAIAAMDEPIRQVLSRMEVAEGLVLEKLTVPIGVCLIIFEARPDALPQIAALAIRSGNGLLLKGGKEASRTNALLHSIIVDAIEEVVPEVGRGLISLVRSREDIDALLALDDVIDLAIPRGGNALVKHIQQNTKIPVLGHADGICHIYVDSAANIETAVRVVTDAKVDYPAACNAVEKVLVHSDLAKDGRLYRLQSALVEAGVALRGGERAVKALGLQAAPSPKVEYGNLTLTLDLVESLEEAVAHIHAHGSSHTEAIITEDREVAEDFLRRVDSACVFHNASTRFADGFRFGLGAEVGISTSRIHARGPVGVEGLLTSKWVLRGNGHTVEKDAHIQYRHRKLPVGPVPAHGEPACNGSLENGTV